MKKKYKCLNQAICLWKKTMVQEVAFMKRIHPRLAVGIFGIIYMIIGIIISLITKKEVFESKIY